MVNASSSVTKVPFWCLTKNGQPQKDPGNWAKSFPVKSTSTKKGVHCPNGVFSFCVAVVDLTAPGVVVFGAMDTSFFLLLGGGA